MTTKALPQVGRRAAPLTEELIIEQADFYYQRYGRWPIACSKKVSALGDSTWSAIDAALRTAGRGLRRRSSLARLLKTHRGVRNHLDLPQLSLEMVLALSDAYFARTGKWPTAKREAIPECPGETWHSVETALQTAIRGIPRRTSLAKLLAECRGRPNRSQLPPLSIPQILAWADDFHHRHGNWPDAESGPVDTSSSTTWLRVNAALKAGLRGLPPGSSLARLLAEHRGVRNPACRPPLSIDLVLGWAQAYRRRFGRWPGMNSGVIPNSDGDTWLAVEMALRQGLRGLPAGTSLRRLLLKGL